jgi:thiosulfate dehydrogenase (quinone) large subunit
MVDLVTPHPSVGRPPRPPIRDADRALQRSGWVWGVLRLAMGWVFLWAFLDKFFGLGFSTCRVLPTAAADQAGSIDYFCEASFLEGGSSLYGFLSGTSATSRTGSWFEWMTPDSPTTQNIWDLLFMLTLLGVGVCLMLGVFVRLASAGGVLLLVSMYLAGFVWPDSNPFLDHHLVYALVLVGIGVADAGRFLGLGRWWGSLPLIEKTPFLH